MPNTVPDSPDDTATFEFSNKTGVSLSASTTVNGIVFNAGASAFTITARPTEGFTLIIDGVGITNNSGIAQNFVVGAGAFTPTIFRNTATAGNDDTHFTINGAPNRKTNGGFLIFEDSSSAGSATFTVEGAMNKNGGSLSFGASSSAGNATLIVRPSPTNTTRGFRRRQHLLF